MPRSAEALAKAVANRSATGGGGPESGAKAMARADACPGEEWAEVTDGMVVAQPPGASRRVPSITDAASMRRSLAPDMPLYRASSSMP